MGEQLDCSLYAELDSLSVQTAMEIDPGALARNLATQSAPTPQLCVSLTFNDRILKGHGLDGDRWGLRFPLNDPNQDRHGTEIKVIFSQTGIAGFARRLTIHGVAPADVEWQFIAQTRVRTGQDDEKMTIVDREVFAFGKNLRPLVYDVSDDVVCIAFEMRTTVEFFRRHPSFTDGDVLIVFADGAPIRTWRALLGHISGYMHEKMSESASEEGVVDVSPFPRAAFLELLLQLHPTGRSLRHSFKQIARTAVSFRASPVVEHLSDYIIDCVHVDPLERLRDAATLGLTPAVEQLVHDAAKSRVWYRWIHEGLKPDVEFGADVYHNVITKAVVNASLPRASPRRVGGSSLARAAVIFSCLLTPPAEGSEGQAHPDHYVISLLGTKFYINQGVLKTHGTEGFPVDDEGNLLARYSSETRRLCALVGLSPGEVFHHLLLSLHPFCPPVAPPHILPALSFAFDHKLRFALEDIEMNLLRLPVASGETILAHLQMSEKFGLRNLLRMTLLRLEDSAAHHATGLVTSAEFNALSTATRHAVLDRVASGWAVSYPKLAVKEPSDHLHRHLSIGCPFVEAFHDEATFASANSAAVFELNEYAEDACEVGA